MVKPVLSVGRRIRLLDGIRDHVVWIVDEVHHAYGQLDGYTCHQEGHENRVTFVANWEEFQTL